MLGKYHEGEQWLGGMAKIGREDKGGEERQRWRGKAKVGKEDSGGEERQRWGGKAKVERVGQIWEGLQMRREGKGSLLKPMCDDLERQGG